MADISRLVSPTGSAMPPAERKVGNLVVHTAANNPAQNIKILIYGDSGKGKSVLAASASLVPEMSPVLFLNAEGGTLSVSKFYPDIDIVNITDFMQMQSIFDALRKGNHGYKTVVIDSITELHRQSMAKIMFDTVTKDPNRDLEVPAQREWGKAGEQIRKLIRMFRDLPAINTIFVALETEVGEEGRPKQIGPSLPGKLFKEVPGYVDIVARMYHVQVTEGDKRVTKRVLLTSGTDKIIAKDRTDCVPTPLPDPTMVPIYTAFVGNPNQKKGKLKNE